MKLKHLLGVGSWSCPLCGDYSSLGFWFRVHLVTQHSMSIYRASRYMVRLCEKLPVYRERVAVAVVPFVRKSAMVQADLFDTKAPLVS